MAIVDTHGGIIGGELHRLAMDAAVGGMAIVDRDGRWLQANPAFGRMLGRDATQLSGQARDAVADDDDAAALDAGLRALADSALPSLHMTLSWRHAEGHPVPSRVDLAPIRGADGHVSAFVLAASEDAHAADGVAQRLAETEATLASISRLQASFAQGVSHDLRAPLRAVDSFSSLLSAHLDDTIDDTAREYLARIRGASARMSTLIDSLLELSRAMRADIRPEPVDLGLLVDWSHAELADADPGREASVEVQPGLLALADERLLRQLVGQLLGNAWKFSRDRERVHVEVTGERRDDRLVLRVRDHGCGFDMRYADKLFEPFQRLHGAEQAGGNGIGLAIVRCIAERHGGRAWAHSEAGEGSTFFVELPAAPETGERT